jgi:YbaB/EbfC DNA-binding family protein
LSAVADRTGAPGPLDKLLERLNRTAEVRDRIKALVGRAESPDGLVKVSCSADDPLRELELHPRARRLPHTELAALIRDTARAARSDLSRQTREVVAEVLGDEGTASAAASLGQLTVLTNTTGQDAQAALDRIRRLVGLDG